MSCSPPVGSRGVRKEEVGVCHRVGWDILCSKQKLGVRGR